MTDSSKNSPDLNPREDEVSLIDLLVVLLRRRKLIIGLTLAAALLGTALVILLPQIRYNASVGEDSISVVNDTYLSTMIFSRNTAFSSFTAYKQVEDMVFFSLKNPANLLAAYRAAEVDSVGELSLDSQDENELINILRSKIVNRKLTDADDSKSGSWILNVQAMPNGFFAITVKSEQLEQAGALQNTLLDIVNAELGMLLSPAAKAEVDTYLEFSRLNNAAEYAEEDRLSAFYSYKDAERLLNGSEEVLMPVQTTSEFVPAPQSPERKSVSDIRNEIKAKVILSVFAIFILSIFLAFILQAIENVKKDPVASEKIRRAIGKNK